MVFIATMAAGKAAMLKTTRKKETGLCAVYSRLFRLNTTFQSNYVSQNPKDKAKSLKLYLNHVKEGTKLEVDI